MPSQVYNNVSSNLFNSLDSASTTVSVTDGAMFPSVAEGDWYPIHVIRGNNAFEIMHVMGSDENGLLTVERAQESTDPLTFESGSVVQIRLTKEALAKIDASEMTVTEQGTSDKRTLENWVSDLKDPEFIAEGGTEARNASSHSGDNLSLRDFGAVGDGVTDDTAAITAALASGRRINGLGRTYSAAAKPATFSGLSNALIKVNTVFYPTRDYLRTDPSKITNGLMYTAWPQDKCYKVGTQLRMWANEKQSHPDGTARIICYISDDDGESWFSEYLLRFQAAETLWSAGWDGETEYLLVRVGANGIDGAPFTYTLYSRPMLNNSTTDYNASWATTNITFPVPSGFTGQPVMVHSFTAGHDGSIVVGASYGEGAAVMRSIDGGINWESHVIATGAQYEEPSVKYDADSGLYVGFMRAGDDSMNPLYWYSEDNLSTISVIEAPSGYFTGGPLAKSAVTFDIDSSGNIHAFTAYRSEVWEQTGTPDRVSSFYIKGPVLAGDFWRHEDTINYFMGSLRRREIGGSSALAQGSVVWNEKANRVHIFFGQEDREGARNDGRSLGHTNRIANIYQMMILGDDLGGFYNAFSDAAKDRTAGTQLRKIMGMDAFAVPFQDSANSSSMVISARPNYGRWIDPIIISDGVLDLNGRRAGRYLIDTEGGSATDDLTTINDSNAVEGDVIFLSTGSSSRDVVVRNNQGNIRCGSDRTLGTAQTYIGFMRDNSGTWQMISYWSN